ncbi:S-adenosyl-L-methionine-dependent methyltransferase, partial [Vararia minispora EC-137]
ITPVEKILLDTIKANGPVSFATYMQMCLSHPTEGYYMKSANSIFGSRGDFITSPEISQVFGELVGVWLLSQYMQNAAPGTHIQIIELGPGRGTLMADVLRTLMQLTPVKSALRSVLLVETSPALRDAQSEVLKQWSEVPGITVKWHESLDDVCLDDNAFTMLVAHEFFDALPFHLLERSHQGWQEVMITVDPDTTAKTVLRASDLPKPLTDPSVDMTLPLSSSRSRLRPVLSSVPSPISNLLGRSSPRFHELPVGSRIEVSPAAFRIAQKIGEIIGSLGRKGAGLLVDYGAGHVFDNSFRAFKGHKIVDPFYLPGQCDLTVNVDFTYLSEALAGTATRHGPLTQHDFLTRMGMHLRVKKLQDAARPERRKSIEDAANRLVDLMGMGKQYKVMGV